MTLCVADGHDQVKQSILVTMTTQSMHHTVANISLVSFIRDCITYVPSEG
jgi:hypothetical protein